jgi:hypothetical protein
MSTACEKAWNQFLEEHPMCGHEGADKVPPGIAGYTAAPFNAWSGWRYRIPGGPIGGQYHGFIAPDDSIDGLGWPAGHDETFRAVDNPAGLGGMPWHGWDPEWGGIPLDEGETVSDYVYRGPAEMRPRANASGGAHVVRAVQTRRSAGFAVAPGNYRGLGAVPKFLGPPVPAPYCPPGSPECAAPPVDPNATSGPYLNRITPGFVGPPVKACPAWGCPPSHPIDIVPGPFCQPGYARDAAGKCVNIMDYAPGPIVPQPPPPSGPQPGPITATGCPAGQYQDAAGN